MRVMFGGYGGGPPDPDSEEDADPYVPKDPPLFLVYNADATFSRSTYLDQGYTHYDLVTIGGAGGSGAGWMGRWSRPGLPENEITICPGAPGGGGGLQRRKGRLSQLPASVAIKVGAAGLNRTVTNTGIEQDSPLTTPPDAGTMMNGGNGGHSAFGTLAKASGGKGGKHGSYGLPTFAGGGDGGVGGRIDAGGGGAGGIPEQVKGDVFREVGSGHKGYYNSRSGIGSGGGGGAAGYLACSVGLHGPSLRAVYDYVMAGEGGGGCRSLEINGFRTPPDPNYYVGLSPFHVLAGWGNAANVKPITRVDEVYGSKAFNYVGQRNNGVVAIRLT